MGHEPLYFYKPAFIVLNLWKFNISPSVDRNLKSASNEFEKIINDRRKVTVFSKLSETRWYYNYFVAFKFIDEVIQ